MICYEIEFNKNKIFTETYPYKIYINGYMEHNKYKDGVLAEKEYVLFLETHSEKYQLSIKHFIKNIIVLDIEIYLEKVESYKISSQDKELGTQYFFFPERKSPLKYMQVKNCDKYFLENIFKKTEKEDLDAYCIASDDFLISLEDIKQTKHGFVRKNQTANVEKKDFFKKILNQEDYEKVEKTFDKFSIFD